MESEIIVAIAADDTEKVRDLLRRDPACAGSRAGSGASAVLYAVYHGRTDLAREVLRAGAPFGIHEAAALGDLPRVRALLADAPADVNSYSGDGFQPLGLASFFGHAEVAAFLLEHGADPAAPSRNGQKVAPIHSAAAAGLTGIVDELARRGADVNAQQQGGFTALHAAIMNRDLATIALLIRSGADCGATDEKGRTPASLAGPDPDAEVRALLKGCREETPPGTGAA